MTNKRIIDIAVKKFETNGHAFTICIDDDGNYWGINNKYLDEHGRLTKELNGFSGNMEHSLTNVLRRCYISARCENEIDDELIKQNDLSEMIKLTKICEEAQEYFK